MEKKNGCLYNFFYGILMILSIFVSLIFVILMEGVAVLGTIPFFALFYFCYIKLTIKKIHHHLCKPGKRFMRFINLFACFIFFNMVVIAAGLYIYNVTQSGMADETDHSFIQMLSIMAKILCWYIASMVLWTQFSNVLILGIEQFPRNLFVFIRQYVPIYLLYQIATFLILFLGDTIITLLSKGENQFMAMGFSYFLFDCTPSDVTFSGLLGNLTSSSSYVVLGAFCLHFLKNNQKETFKDRLKTVFDEDDTKKMLVMTVICIVATLLTSGSVSLKGFSLAGGIPKSAIATLVVLAVLGIIWIVSAVSFIKSTNLLEYFSTLITMIFIESVIPIPDITWKTLVIAVLCIILRIFVFVAIAMLSAMLTKAFEDNKGVATVQISEETKQKMEAIANAVSVAVERKKAFDRAFDRIINKK